ncbi:hypothetical protein QTN25_007068 [Entamoeba marina]
MPSGTKVPNTQTISNRMLEVKYPISNNAPITIVIIEIIICLIIIGIIDKYLMCKSTIPALTNVIDKTHVKKNERTKPNQFQLNNTENK